MKKTNAPTRVARGASVACGHQMLGDARVVKFTVFADSYLRTALSIYKV